MRGDKTGSVLRVFCFREFVCDLALLSSKFVEGLELRSLVSFYAPRMHVTTRPYGNNNEGFNLYFYKLNASLISSILHKKIIHLKSLEFQVKYFLKLMYFPIFGRTLNSILIFFCIWLLAKRN